MTKTVEEIAAGLGDDATRLVVDVLDRYDADFGYRHRHRAARG